MRTLRLGARGSPLALRQTELVSELLRQAEPGLDVEAVVVRTQGDRDTATPLDQIGGQGVFVTEVEAAVAAGRADAAVHSAKDMPSVMASPFVLGAVPRRADPRDGLVGATLAGLPAGGLVATGSARRRAQLAALRPDLVFTDLRGNMARRVAMADEGEVSAVVVAVAAMERLGWLDKVRHVLDPVDVLPQAGQGAIAVQCRADDATTRALLGHIDHEPTHRALRSERAVLATLGGNCALPVGAFAECDEAEGAGGVLSVSGLLASGDGHTVIRVTRHGDDPEAVGAAVARALLEGGGASIEGFESLLDRGAVTVYLVGAGPGDPGLLTQRGAALLARADVVLHDRLVSPAVLDLVPSSARVIDVGKDPDTSGGGAGAGRQEAIARLLVEHGRASSVVVRLKGGDPFLFGRGGEEVEALARAGLAWEVVPGVTSAFGVPAAVGIPVTQRGVAASVTVVTGRVGAADGSSEHDWEALARVGGTLVVLMGMTTRSAIAAALIKGGRAPDTPVAVIASGTTASQQVRRTTLRGLADVELGPPAVIVVGGVAALGQHERAATPQAPLAGRTVVVTRTGERGRDLVDAERAGATAVELPLTRQVEAEDGGAALQAAARAVQENDWVVLTSVNAVDRFMGALRDARALGSVLVAAVGPATADALRRTGVRPDLVPTEHSARGLVDAFPDAPSTGTWRVLFPSADRAPETIVEGLGQKGWDVHRVEAYRTVARSAPEPALLDRVTAADALTLTAPSVVQGFLALRTTEGQPVRVPDHVVCIGPTTADAARAAGLENVHEATSSSAQGIVDELIAELGPGGDHGP